MYAIAQNDRSDETRQRMHANSASLLRALLQLNALRSVVVCTGNTRDRTRPGNCVYLYNTIYRGKVNTEYVLFPFTSVHSIHAPNQIQLRLPSGRG